MVTCAPLSHAATLSGIRDPGSAQPLGRLVYFSASRRARLAAFVPCIQAHTWGTFRGKGSLELRCSEANGQDSHPAAPHGRDDLLDRPGIDLPVVQQCD